MKHFIKIKIPAKEEDYLDHTTCDICKEVIDKRPDNYDKDAVEINRQTGNFYPGYCTGETTSVDMCPKCFKDKLAPWLIANGATPRVEEWE